MPSAVNDGGAAAPKPKKSVHEPVVKYDARGSIQTHGTQKPVRGVWHSTECGDSPGIQELQAVVNFWKNQGLGYGAQLMIDKDGNTAVCANPDQITWAVENHNTGTYSVELVGYAKFGKLTWFTRLPQLRELAKWMAWLNKQYGIPLTLNVNAGWSRHLDQSKAFGGTHTDPGTGFPRGFVLTLARRYRKNGWK